jgi:hypothetical protein
MARPSLVVEETEFRDSSGHPILLCAIDEMNLLETLPSVAAVATLGGISLCREHLDRTIGYLRDGQPMTKIVMDALAGDF